MQLTRDDLTRAAETANLDMDDFEIRPAYEYAFRAPTALGVVVPGRPQMLEFMVALAVHLTEQGRADDALKLGGDAGTDSVGWNHIIYWPGATLSG